MPTPALYPRALRAFATLLVFVAGLAPAPAAVPALPGVTAPAAGTAPAPTTETIQKQVAESQVAFDKSASTLKTALAGNTEAAALLKQVTDAFGGGQAASYISAFNKLYAAKLTPAQMKLAGELRDSAAALLLQKNISTATPAAANSVTGITNAIKSGNYSAAATSLSALAADNKLTAPQKELAKSLLGQYADLAKNAAAGAASQAAGALRGLGLGGN